jgi:hypothetical protein
MANKAVNIAYATGTVYDKEKVAKSQAEWEIDKCVDFILFIYFYSIQSSILRPSSKEGFSTVQTDRISNMSNLSRPHGLTFDC